MDDIIEMLRERNEPVPVPLELPDEDLLVEIEEQLYVSLPDDLRHFLLNASDVVCGCYEPVTVTDPQSHTYLPEMAAVAWSMGLPRKYLPICEFNGAYYCISQDGTILLWDESTSDQRWDSIWHWIREVWLAD